MDNTCKTFLVPLQWNALQCLLQGLQYSLGTNIPLYICLPVCLSALILCLSRFFLSHFSYHDNKWLIDCINKGCSGMLNAVKKLLHVLDVSNVSPSSELWTSAYNTFFTAFSNEVAYRQPILCVRLHIFVTVVDHGQFLLWESAVLKFILNKPNGLQTSLYR